jgi:glucose/sorbosone dehydrogenase
MRVTRLVLLALVLVLGGLFLAMPSDAQLPPPPTLALQPMATGLSEPVSITHAGDGSGRLFIVQRGGRILVHDGTQVLPTPFLDIDARVNSGGGEQGLLGLAFHPSYASNGYFYVYYTRGNGDVIIARYTATPPSSNVANVNPEVILKTISHQQASNHNGGQLQFGPDGYLYAAVGDGGTQGDPENDAQRLDSLLGKILRLDVDAGSPYIPPTNPFVGQIGAMGEIWALGLRNPWRFSFDRLTGDMFIGDVGLSTREEIDFQPAGVGSLNYCWRRYEGSLLVRPGTACTFGTVTFPILELLASDGNCSIIAGYRYRGVQSPALQGWFLYGDFCGGTIHGAMPVPGWTSTPLLDTGFSISSFGEDEGGELYVADYYGGAVHRIVGPLPTSATLTIARTGSGGGSVTSGSGEIDCGGTCSAVFPTGVPITVSAAADPSSIFLGWSGGGCGTVSPCVVTLTFDTVISAIFIPAGSRLLSAIVRGADNGIYHSRYGDAAWTGWTALPGATADIPALVASGGGRLDLVVRGIDNGVYHNQFVGTWLGWIPLPGATASIPALAATPGLVLDLVVRGTDNGVYHNHCSGGSWSGWVALPGATRDIPALAASGGGVLDLVVRGIDDGVYWNHYDGTSWSGWVPLPGATRDIPALAASGGGELDLVVRGIDDGIYWNHYDGTSWTGWVALPGATASIPALAASGGGVLDLVVRGVDNGVYWSRYDGTSWSEWIALPGATADVPALVTDAGILDLLVRGVDNRVYHNRNAGTGWLGWTLVPGVSTISRPALAVE